MQTAAGRATAARGLGRQPAGRQLGDLLGIEQLLEAIACPLRHRASWVVLDVSWGRHAQWKPYHR